MKFRKPRGPTKLLIFSLIAGTLMSFQNCGQSYDVEIKTNPFQMSSSTPFLAIKEGDPTLHVSFSRTISNTTVSWQISPSVIGKTPDFQTPAGSLSVTDPTTSVDLPVGAIIDDIYEGTEGLSIHIIVGSPQLNYTMPLNVIESLPPPSMPSASITVLEGSSGVLNIAYDRAPPNDVLISIKTQDGTGIAGTDYLPINSSITLPAGQTQVSVPIQSFINNNNPVSKVFYVVSQGQGDLVESIPKTHVVNISPMASCGLSGQTVISGQSITVYSSSTVPSGSTCVSQNRLCTNGVLSGSFTNLKCATVTPSAPTPPPVNCTFGSELVLSGGSPVTAYQNPVVPSGSQCISEQRSCNNGVLSGSYVNPTCVVSNISNPPPPLPCSFNGGSVVSGSQVLAYQSPSVAFGSQCVSQERTCSNGVLSGTYANANCVVNPVANCSFNGTTITSGSQVTAWQTPIAPTNGPCASEQRVCLNGVLSGTFTNQSCNQVNQPTLSFSNAIANEGSALVVTASLNYLSKSDVTFTYQLQTLGVGNSFAIVGTDLPDPGSVTATIPAGQVSTQISIPTTINPVYTTTQNIAVVTTKITNSVTPSASAQLQIVNTTAVPTVSVTTPTATYAAGQSANYAITLSGPVKGTSIVTYYTEDGSAISGVNYNGISPSSPGSCVLTPMLQSCPPVAVRWLTNSWGLDPQVPADALSFTFVPNVTFSF